MIYDVRHVTHFRYAAPVRFARCNLRLKPVAWDGQTLERHRLTVRPDAEIARTGAGGYPVEVTRLTIERPAAELVIESGFRMRVDRMAAEVRADDASLASVAKAARGSRGLEPAAVANYLYPSPLIGLDPAIVEWCGAELDPDRGAVEAGLALARAIKASFAYDGKATETDTLPAEAFGKRRGVCQDFAQVMIAGLRGAGLPAAYVSGYLRTQPPPGKPRLVGADATHAWVMLWCGEARGWIGFDPTNGCTMGSDHIVLAMGRDYADVAPISGIFLGREGQRIDVAVDVVPIEETVPQAAARAAVG